jgi:hypothetical protein
LLLTNLLERMPEHVRFDADDLRRLDTYFARRFDAGVTFDQIEAFARERDAKRKAAKRAWNQNKASVGPGRTPKGGKRAASRRWTTSLSASPPGPGMRDRPGGRTDLQQAVPP